MNIPRSFLVLSAFLFIMGSCSSTNKSTATDNDTSPDTIAQVMCFNADSAFSFVEVQCSFGPRVPNSSAHSLTAKYLSQKLSRYGADVILQDAILTAFDGTKINAKNIIGQFNTAADKRILLLAHWDSRPWADADPDASKRNLPVMGANDGASGVAVILELARLFSLKSPAIGVDILFVDAEDWGTANNDDSWALGTQYWVAHPHRDAYRPMFAILLDMVGDRGAKFSKEYFSMAHAAATVNLVWDIARRSGFAEYFPAQNGGAITDDHVVLIKAGIPAIDIIHMDMDSPSGFFPQWHTADDNLQQIDKNSLKAVGQTISNLIYSF